MNPTSLQYIRDYYEVPAKLGGRVIYNVPASSEEFNGTIVGAQNAHVLVQLDGETDARPYHPTWNLIYV